MSRHREFQLGHGVLRKVPAAWFVTLRTGGTKPTPIIPPPS
jgi:hypothetical protein